MRRYAAAGCNQQEPGGIGPAEEPSVLGKAARLPLDNGVAADRLAAACEFPTALVVEVLDACSGPLLELRT